MLGRAIMLLNGKLEWVWNNMIYYVVICEIRVMLMRFWKWCGLCLVSQKKLPCRFGVVSLVR